MSRACLECHPDAARQVMATSHWAWESHPVVLPGREGPVLTGKKHLLNNFCVGVASNWPACTSCHAGYGWVDEGFDFSQEQAVVPVSLDDSNIVLTSEDEERATEAWRLLVAEDVPNVYLLEGGLNRWLETFGHVGHEDCPPAAEGESGEERLRHLFRAALGSEHPSGDPGELEQGLEFVPKVKLERKKALGGGGCG